MRRWSPRVSCARAALFCSSHLCSVAVLLLPAPLAGLVAGSIGGCVTAPGGGPRVSRFQCLGPSDDVAAEER